MTNLEFTVLPLSFKMPDMPQVAKYCLNYLDDPDADAAVLTQSLNYDPELSKIILTVANSAPLLLGHGKYTRDLKKAVIRIGFERLRHVFLLYALNNSLIISSNSFFDQQTFMRHSLFVSLLSSGFAKLVVPEFVREAQLSGLIHDVGLGVMTTQCPDVLAKLMDYCAEHKQNFTQAEKNLQVELHNEYSAEVACHWLPISDTVRKILEGHNHSIKPTSSSQEPESLTILMVLIDILNISDTLAHGYGFGFKGYVRDTKISSKLLTRLGIKLEDAKENLRESIEFSSVLLQAFY